MSLFDIFVIFIFSILITTDFTSAKPASYCNAATVRTEFRESLSLKPYLIYGFEFQLFPLLLPGQDGSSIQFQNFKFAKHNSSYRTLGPLRFSSTSFSFDVDCKNNSDACLFAIPNGAGVFELSVYLNGQKGTPMISMGTVFSNATIYQAKNGRYFDNKVNKCLTLDDTGAEFPRYILHTSICCSGYLTVDIPDIPTPQCIEFNSSTSITSTTPTSTLTAALNSVYKIQESSVAITVNSFRGPPNSDFYLQPNEDATTCSSSMAMNCSQHIDGNDDFELDLSLLLLTESGKQRQASIGNIIRKNGHFMKEHLFPLTEADPCVLQNKNYIEYGSEIALSSKMCCSKFAPHTAADTCAQYESRTVFTDKDRANVELSHLQIIYSIQNNRIKINIHNFTSLEDSNGLFYYPSAILTPLFCKTTTTNPETECFVKFETNGLSEFDFIPSFGPDGFKLFDFLVKNNVFVSPNVTVVNPCVTVSYPYNYVVPRMEAKTTFCCISSVDGPWPLNT